MEKKSVVIRAAIMQLLGLAALLVSIYVRGLGGAEPLLYRISCFLLYPLGGCLLSYVLWMLLLRGLGVRIAPAVPRVILSVLPALLILVYGVVHLIYWVLGWRPVGVTDMAVQLEAAVRNPIAIGVMLGAMLFLVLGLETRPAKAKGKGKEKEPAPPSPAPAVQARG